MIADIGNSDFLMPSVPLYFIGVLLTWSVVTKRKYFNSLILSICFSSIAFVFLYYKNQLSDIGNSLIGFEIAMYASPFISIPLAGFGWYVGRTINIFKTILFSILSISIYVGMAYSYKIMVIKNSKILLLNAEINCKQFPFHCAVKNNDLQGITKLKLEGFNIEARDTKSGLTALWHAIDNQDLVKVLLENGANSNSINRQNETPLAQVLAISIKPNYPVAELLLKHGALINQKIGISKKMTILNIQIVNKNIEGIKFSLEHGADPNLIDDYGQDACTRFRKMKLEDTLIRKKICKSTLR